VSPANVLSETIVFHLGRMFHQAGRCVECDACVNACPMGIDLRLFTQKLASDAKELFGSVPGVTDDAVPALNTFTQDDSECFITDPEEK
jgi:Fe-S-cluster-containing hydrogenase component 2